jgi:hypothetical protein
LAGLSAETTVARFEGTDGTQEVNATKIWPQRFFEIELRLRALP